MDFFNAFLRRYWSLVLNITLLLFLIFTTGYFLMQDDKEKAVETESISLVEIEEEKTSKIYVDIKGAVKKPGVYEVNNGNIINDVIKLAGGLTKNAYTHNINLSKKVEPEMVIYVFTKTEYKKLNKKQPAISECQTNTYVINNCVDDGSSTIVTNENSTDTTTQNITGNFESSIIPNSKEEVVTENNLVSINTATIEELMTLNGIGESKANSIIRYRNENGLFKSIEEIKNVSGIGEAAFEKIKDNITV